jgi:peptidoglycan-N-acetylglucosamine deacetylase
LILQSLRGTIPFVKKNKKKKISPRYFTIRIQYYPIDKKIIYFFIFCLVYFSVYNVIFFIKTNWIGEYTKPVAYSLYPSVFSEKQSNSFSHSYDVVFHGDRTKKNVALTFDADMTPGMKADLDSGAVVTYYNKPVIDILNETQTKATLFLAGMWIEQYPQVTKELANNPLFELASHSYSHPGFDGECFGLTPIPDSADADEIQKTQALLRSVAGVSNVLFRFPGGCYSQNDVTIVTQNGLTAIQWDASGQDGFNNDPYAIETNVLSQVQNGSIIVLHMHGAANAPKTAEALPTIIATLKEQGYTFVTVSQLLNTNSQFFSYLR